MNLPEMRGTWQRLKAHVSKAVVQDCPPELAACQVCNRSHCPSEAWLKCERRLAAMRYLERGDRSGIEQLRQAHAMESPSCVEIQAERNPP